jgi:glyoxylase-like metal-dependent hydrolase (beta-lactamase superfamily II)
MAKIIQNKLNGLIKIPNDLEVSSLRAIIAPNGNAYTNTGTRSYLVGSEQLAIIDPGPNITSHFNNIIQAIGNSQLTHIILTHSHQDHCALAIRLAIELNAEIYMFGTPKQSNYDLLKNICDPSNPLKFIDKIDKNIIIQKVLDGDKIFNTEWSFEVIFTPGHWFDHICLAWEQTNIIFSGDHVMGWSSTVIVPPLGNMSDFIESLKKTLIRQENTYFPTHGEPIRDAKSHIQSQLNHRNNREKQILTLIKKTAYTPDELVPLIYKNLISELREPAVQNVFATLIHLSAKSNVNYKGELSRKTKFLVT